MTVMLRQLGEVEEKLEIASQEDPDLLDRLRHELDPKQLMQSLQRDFGVPRTINRRPPLKLLLSMGRLAPRPSAAE